MMQDPNDEQIKKLIAAGLSDEDIIFYMKNQSKFGGQQVAQPQEGFLTRAAKAVKNTAVDAVNNPEHLWQGFKQGAQQAMTAMASSGVLGPGGVQASYTTKGGQPITREQVDRGKQELTQQIQAQGDIGSAGELGRFAGNVVATLPYSAALTPAAGMFGEAAIASRLGAATTKLGAVAKGTIAAIPKNVVGGVAATALTNPEQFGTPSSALRAAGLASVGALFEGVFKKPIASPTAADDIAAEVMTVLPPKGPPPNPEAAQELYRKLDDFIGQFKDLTYDNPLATRPRVLEPRKEGFKLWMTEEQPMQKYKGLEIPQSDRALPWEPRRKVNQNSPDVQEYAQEINSDVRQIVASFKSIIRITDNIKRGTHTEVQLRKLPSLLEEADKLSLKVAQDMMKLGKSAEEVRNLLPGMIRDETGRSIPVNIRGQQKPNMKNPIESAGVTSPANPDVAPRSLEPGLPYTKTSEGTPPNPPTILKPGSGDQSAYPYTDPAEGVHPLAVVSVPKVEGTGNITPGMPDFYNNIKSKIDFGNRASNEARAARERLLDTFSDRAKTRGLDYLHPMRKVSEETYDLGQKYLRVNSQAEENAINRLAIPQPDGTYVDGAETLVPLMREVGTDPQTLEEWGMYAHARQSVQGIKTPFDIKDASQLVPFLEQKHPHFKDVYDRRILPLNSDVLRLMDGYGLMSQPAFEHQTKNPEYAPLSRAVYGDPLNSYGSMKARTNPTSNKVVSDWWHAMNANIRGIVRAGERQRVLISMVEASQQIPELQQFIRLKPYEKIKQVTDLLDQLPPDLPTAIREDIANTFALANGNGVYPIRMNGGRYIVELSPELNESFDLMARGGVRPMKLGLDPNKPWEKLLLAPIEGTAKLEKTATGVYSVYRDLFKAGTPFFGVLSDAIETKFNIAGTDLKFNILTDPVKYIFAHYNNAPIVRDLKINRGVLGHRFENPSAMQGQNTIDDLVKLAKFHGVKARIMQPGKAFSEFAGVLSNAPRGGLVMRNADKLNPSQRATLFNNILGDPALGGAAAASVSRLTGFMRYPIQATRAQLNSIEKIIATKDPAKIGWYAAKLGWQFGAPAAALTALGMGSKRVVDMSKDAVGRRYFFLPSDDEKEVIAIPKPQGIVGTYVTAVQQMMYELQDRGDTQAAETIGKSAIQAMTPNVLPMTWNMGQSLFTGKNLNLQDATAYSVVPNRKVGMMPADAGSPTGTNTARFLASTIGGAAGKWDQVLRTFLISDMYNAYQVADNKMFGNPKQMEPFNTFKNYPLKTMDASNAGNRYIQQFYDEFGEYGPIIKSLNAAANSGKPAAVNLIIQGNKDKLKRAYELAGMKQTLDFYNQQINFAKENEIYSPQERRQKIDDLQQARNAKIKEFVKAQKR